MSLRYAILGFLSTTPTTGYKLSRQFGQGVGALWQALPSQIYPELRELEKLKLIVGKVAPHDRLKRRVYFLTESGARALQEWLEADNEYPPERDSERIRLLLLDHAPLKVIRRHLERHRDHHTLRLALWQTVLDSHRDGSHPRMRARLAGRAREQHGLIIGLKVLAFDGNVRRSELEVVWAEEALAWLAKLEKEEKAQADASEKADARQRRGARDRVSSERR